MLGKYCPRKAEMELIEDDISRWTPYYSPEVLVPAHLEILRGEVGYYSGACVISIPTDEQSKSAEQYLNRKDIRLAIPLPMDGLCEPPKVDMGTMGRV